MTPVELEAAKRRYMRLLIHQGCNVQPGQQLLIIAEPSALDLLEYAAQAAYQRGARYVDYSIALPKLERAHVQLAPAGQLTYVPTYKTVQMDQLTDGQGAYLGLMSQDEPDLYEGCDPAVLKQVAELKVGRRDAIKRFTQEGLLGGKVSWCGGGVPSPNWAQKVFPAETPERAVQRLWEDILKMVWADQEDCEDRWSHHLDELARHRDELDARQIRELRFVNSAQGTDLTVRLSPQARWISGRTRTGRGVPNCPNIPTFECFTTPDWRGTTGTVGCTRPVMINGSLVEGLRLTFADGEIVNVQAVKNAAAYEALINTPGDATAKRLGEVALVGVDSPIFQNNRIYHHTLYDENAACHIATGMAYTVGLENGDSLTPAQLDELGCNRNSKTHQDIMISDEETTVYADGKELMVRGKWV